MCDECIGIFWMTMCIFMVINIFSPLTNHQSGDYQSCSCRDRKNAVMISDHAFPWRDIKVE